MWWLEVFDDDATQPIFDFFPLSFCRWSPIPVKVDILKGGMMNMHFVKCKYRKCENALISNSDVGPTALCSRM